MCVVQGTATPEKTCPTTRSKTALVTSFSYKDKTNPFSRTQVESPNASSTFACYNGGKQEESKGPACPEPEKGQPAGSLQNKNDQLATEHELKFSYYPNGAIKTSTDAAGRTTEYVEDEKGNLKETRPPVPLAPTKITMDADSRPHLIADGAGHVETIAHDKLDRITEIAYTGTGTAKTVKFEYDADGNVTKREDSTGATRYTSDPLNRVTKEELPGGVRNEYAWDNASNMTAFTDGGGTTKYKGNGLNEIESMLEPGESKETIFGYDNDHRLNKISYPSGAVESYKLEPTTGRPETISVEHVTGTTVPRLTYTYKEAPSENATSRLQTVAESTGTTISYKYDPLRRLTEAKATGANPSLYQFALDGVGNRTKQTVNLTKAEEPGAEKLYFPVNIANEAECRQSVAPPCSTANEQSAYEYDKAGEETAIVPKNDPSGATFAYNAASELSTLTPSKGSALSLSYGGSGQDDLTAIGASTTLQNSLLGLTREVNTTGTSYFARTPNGLLIDERTPAGKFNPLFDAQGDVIALVSSTGKVERTFHYGPYGENIKSEGTQTIPYLFGFKGGYRMPAGNTGKGNVVNSLMHFGARYYDPTSGRWTQQDPQDHVGGATQGDRFLFAGSDPINKSDPSGNGFIEEGLEEIGEFGLTEAGGAVVGCLSVGSAYIESGPYGAAAACAVGGYLGYEGGDTTGVEFK